MKTQRDNSKKTDWSRLKVPGFQLAMNEETPDIEVEEEENFYDNPAIDPNTPDEEYTSVSDEMKMLQDPWG